MRMKREREGSAGRKSEQWRGTNETKGRGRETGKGKEESEKGRLIGRGGREVRQV